MNYYTLHNTEKSLNIKNRGFAEHIGGDGGSHPAVSNGRGTAITNVMVRKNRRFKIKIEIKNNLFLKNIYSKNNKS